MIKTSQKLALARALSRTIVSGRKLLGRSPRVDVRRQGCRWQLDLEEGIDLAVYLGVYQKVPVQILDRMAPLGDLYLDIGANIGALALPVCAHLGPEHRVVAIEPTRFAFQKLEHNLALNPELADRFVAVQAFLAAEASKDQAVPEVYSSWPVGGQGQDGLHPMHYGRPMPTEGGVVTTLDDLMADPTVTGGKSRISGIKLDVDGHELDVLRGATRTLENRPWILMELAPYVHEDATLRELLTLLSDYGYVMEEKNSGKPVPADLGRVKAMIPEGSSVDVLVRPADI